MRLGGSGPLQRGVGCPAQLARVAWPQVEHTITEEITGVDIVQSQIKIAGGASLASLGLGTQADVPPVYGFAIQCRVTSEDPEQNFQPDAGRIEAYRVPGGPGIRMDGAVTTGNVVSRYYDSLLAKTIASAPTFNKAVQKMQRALNEFQASTDTAAWGGGQAAAYLGGPGALGVGGGEGW